MIKLDHIPFSGSVKQTLIDRQRRKYESLSSWRFNRKRWDMIYFEGPEWEKTYAPINLRGKTVLDVGAGCGETAKFFLEHGAAKVICVECDGALIPYLKFNALAHSGITVIDRPFKLADLQIPHDFLKMDIEGYEECLLGVDLSVPAVLEIHGLQLKDRFAVKGYRLSRHFGCDWWTCYGYWKC